MTLDELGQRFVQESDVFKTTANTIGDGCAEISPSINSDVQTFLCLLASIVVSCLCRITNDAAGVFATLL